MLSEILAFISPAGWTIVVSTCTDQCSIDTCRIRPTNCQNHQSSPTIETETIYVRVPNVNIVHDSPSGVLVLAMTTDTWVSQAATNETYPCSPFVISTYNVSIARFQFSTASCVTELPNYIAVSGRQPQLLWLMTTPVIVVSDNAPSTQLSYLQFTSLSTVAGLGDVVVRIIPENEGVIVNLNNSVFSNIIGRIDSTSPVSRAGTSSITPGVLLPEYSGSITVTNTRLLTLRHDDLTNGLVPWMGSARTLIPSIPCVVCKTEADLHRTNVIYIITVSVLSGIIVIFAAIAVFVHMRNRLKAHQIALAEKQQ